MEMSHLRRDIAPYVAHFANKSLGIKVVLAFLSVKATLPIRNLL